MTKLLIVEDDLELAELMKTRLSKEGYIVGHTANGNDACRKILEQRPDLVILDVMLPGMDGFDVCKKIRPEFNGAILILTARDDDLDQILGLELGADDFIVKPVRPRLLLARIRALLRRSDRDKEIENKSPIRIGEVIVDPKRREARLAETSIDLTTIEFDLLWYLVSNAGKVLSRNDIHLALYNSEYDGLDRAIDVYVSRIRQKLGDDPSSPFYLKTVRGVGYLFAGEQS